MSSDVTMTISELFSTMLGVHGYSLILVKTSDCAPSVRVSRTYGWQEVRVGRLWLEQHFPLTCAYYRMGADLFGVSIPVGKQWVDPADLAQFKLGKGEL